MSFPGNHLTFTKNLHGSFGCFIDILDVSTQLIVISPPVPNKTRQLGNDKPINTKKRPLKQQPLLSFVKKVLRGMKTSLKVGASK
jgi:hypothetical protein